MEAPRAASSMEDHQPFDVADEDSDIHGYGARRKLQRYLPGWMTLRKKSKLMLRSDGDYVGG